MTRIHTRKSKTRLFRRVSRRTLLNCDSAFSISNSAREASSSENGNRASSPEIKWICKIRKIKWSPSTLANLTHLIYMEFYVSYSSALDDFWWDGDGALHKNDALILQACDPFDHLFADFPIRDDDEGLDGISPLAKVEKTHLVPLRARGLNTRTEEDRLAL